MHTLTRQTGVTLVELMITITVLAILASIASPAMNIMDNRRLTAASQSLYENLQLARTEAIKQSRDMFFVVDPGDGSGWCIGISDTTGCDCQQTAVAEEDACTIIAAVESGNATRVLRRVSGNDFRNITLTAPAAASEVRFNFVRGTADQTLTLSVQTPKNQQRSVTVNLAGRIALN
ncbi:GspH/FimT family pseudopilin [Thiorhodospira sibirica]|uniref:GspH/FimT family pseudopilin n=1 Tax=Thiorhodospira sibirica TaxID=154347 RepID=UPI00022C5DD5|nr:GspH/FimT family pseudopilin [Thiorhodospira sibirica]